MGNEKNISPLKSIRAKCLDCMCGSISEIKLCTGDGVQSTSCALYPYRFGRRPPGGNKRVLSDAQRQAMSERMKKNLEKMKMAKEAKSAVTDPV